MTLRSSLRQHPRAPCFGLTVVVLVTVAVAFNATAFGALGGYALVTLLLTCAGLTVVLSFAVLRRTKELGVRMALGASAARIVGLLMRQGILLMSLGAALGLALGIDAARLLSDRLFGVAFDDVSSWNITALTVVAVASFAVWLPARNATRIEPTEALRHE